MRSLRLLSLAVLATLLAAGVAPAQPFNYVYQFNAVGGTPSASFNMPVGTNTLDVQLYLVETDTAGTLRNSGLFSAGGRLSYNPTTAATVLASSDITRNPAVDQGLGRGVRATNATVSEQVLSTPFGPASAADPNRILWGTFRLTGGAGTGNVTLTAADPPTANDTLTGAGTPIDSQIQSATAS